MTNNATLSLGTTGLTLGGTYTQSSGSTLTLTVNSASQYGHITAPLAAVVAASTISIHLANFISNNTQFDIINTSGAGVGSDPTTIVTDIPRYIFSSSISSGNLVLTANINLNGLADNPNALNLANALFNPTNPSSDMENVLTSMLRLTDAQITAALNTMGPIVDRGIIDNSTATLNNFIGASLERVQTVLSRQDIIKNSLDHVENSLNQLGSSNATRSSDQDAATGIWAKPYGSYLNQNSREYISGYQSWNAGTVVGYDRLLSDNFMLGISGGYAYGQVNAQAENGNTDVTSAQGTLYAGYNSPDQNYFVNAAGSMAWNWYDGRRDIIVGSLNRTADAQYDGQQYSTYIESGYKFRASGDSNIDSILGDNVDVTPLVSLQWTHLSLGSYTESNADSLDLNVDKQNYDILESGLGASFSLEENYDWGLFVPELHAKWLYDIVNDPMSITSSFVGGGTSFTANGVTPQKNGINFGSKLSFDFKNDLSLIAEWDINMKEGFLGVYGSGTVRYKF